MNATALTSIVHPSAWAGPDLVNRDDWRVTLTPQCASELVSAAYCIDRTSLLTISSSPVDRLLFPHAARQLAEIEQEIMHGRGSVLLNGLDPELDDGILKACYWIMTNLLGKPLRTYP